MKAYGATLHDHGSARGHRFNALAYFRLGRYHTLMAYVVFASPAGALVIGTC
jgi:hypothetical protein